MIKGRSYVIVNLSEGGVRFWNLHQVRLPDDPFQFTLHMRSQPVLTLTGRILRYEKMQAVVIFIKGPTYPQMMAEQTFINRASRD